MIFLTAASPVVIPLLAFILPGLALITAPRRFSDLPAAAAHTILWSISLLTLTSFITSSLGLPVLLTVPFVALIMVAGLSAGRWKTWRDPRALWLTLAFVTCVLALVAAFSLPYFLFHLGLPTGDAQKAIFWAQKIIDTNSIPDYSVARMLLNRDPVDFYTPGLHTLTALVMQLSAHPLIAVGMFSVAAAIAAAAVSLALATEVFPNRPFVVIVPFLVVTNLRFLRYLREPGYHFQNIVGEILLFGLLWLGVRLLRRWHWPDAILAIMAALSLALTHQFSSFMALFVLLPIGGAFIFRYRHSAASLARAHPIRVLVLLSALVLLILSGFVIDLHHKIPHLFTRQPHLLHLVPSPAEYMTLMGSAWFVLGLAGLAVLAWQLRRKDRDIGRLGFVLCTFVPLILSQGPRLGIDVPPVRALFYSVIPLSITGAYLITLLWHFVVRQAPAPRRTLRLLLVLLVISSAARSVSAAYVLTHSVRTNATLTPEQVFLAEQLAAPETNGAVLIDDYNRRSASWLLLSGQPMYTRIAADLEQQMNEARQSPERHELYLNQLDFEKIFSLGSLPLITQLMEKHNIHFITGIESSSDAAFQHNPALAEVARAGDIILRGVKGTVPGQRSPVVKPQVSTTGDPPEEIGRWLLQPTTLANDIGDREDTFEHLPASLRTTRLSAPFADSQRTYRVTSSPLIPLRFNVGDYVRVLWEEEMSQKPDSNVQFLLVASAPEPLTLTTPSQDEYQIENGASFLTLPFDQVPWDKNGFITMTLHNPNETPVEIDVIAIGLSTSR